MPTGHGCFENYLYKYRKCKSPNCINCNEPYDTAEHALYNCPFYETKRPNKLPLIPATSQFRQYVTLIMTKRWELEQIAQNNETQ